MSPGEAKAPLGVVLAGGGTGGHIFPAIAALERLLEIEPHAVAHALCSGREIDRRILTSAAAAGLPLTFEPLPAAPLLLRPAGLVRFVWRWGGSVRGAREALRAMRRRSERVVVLATGGFVAAPVAQAARVERVPLVLLNQDAPPGKANRWIATRATRVLTSALVERDGWERIAPVVRRAGLAPGDRPACRRTLGLDPDRPVLLITGASQGARTINALAGALAEHHAEAFSVGAWQAVHQTGVEDCEPWRRAWSEAGVPALVEPFFEAMGACWGAAELAVSRAGAGSVAEAWANRVPTVFLPYPHHRDQHQRRNAEPLERAGGALIETDLIDARANLEGAGARIVALMRDDASRRAMRSALAGLGPVDGAERLARETLAAAR
jgi:UDP-N-acetylglucosamine--N-acetylmuramyl-(pentapeptide) pyrophosphoryl-undecaprenol N-acetylglucosamine transferase